MKVAAFSVVLFVMSGITAGQTSGSGSSSAQTSESSNSPKLQTVRGCLSKTGNTYADSWRQSRPAIPDCGRGYRSAQTQAWPHS